FFATRNGTVKKTPLSDYSRPRATGIWAINLDEGDGLVDVQLTDGHCNVMLFASNGKAVRFDEGEVRPMGRTATGVRGIRLTEDEQGRLARVVSLIVVEGEGDILTACANGYGKRTPVSEFPRKGRGTQGVIAIQTSERNGELVGAIQLTERHEILLISDQGTLVRTRAAEVSQVGRNTQGVTLMRLSDGEQLIAVERVDELGEDEDAAGEAAADETARPQPEA
ncbi:MAG TPA: DNA gyrase C-terminal beta-propeller domain-containing protein, partial [Arenimonas sp.]|nr:DNA gyrase C-terminal beta-propeller domain-containing protein [Arenimonas sp.]